MTTQTKELIDLREHFGIWERCGNTRFWVEMGLPDYRHVFVNPADGIMITVQDYPAPGGPAFQVLVRDASELDEEEITPAYKKNYPWVKQVLSEFFAGLMYTRVGLIKHTPQSFFVKYYKDQTRKYEETGKGHSKETGKDELLEAVKRLLGSLEERALILKKVILREELDEFLEGYGIIEC